MSSSAPESSAASILIRIRITCAHYMSLHPASIIARRHDIFRKASRIITGTVWQTDVYTLRLQIREVQSVDLLIGRVSSLVRKHPTGNRGDEDD